MTTWTETTYMLASEDHPLICAHADNVAFFLPGYMADDSRGLTLRLTRAHIADVAKLLEALKALPDLGEPFENDEDAA